ncbi:MAG: hypothetical protein KKC76_20640 [Proteobacteria bacterium]|nr:hypothetical protein [Pseudomonadota bacterium]MBU4298385.1 hypothetical protein [Pseudomonadota bacterium]MCG2746940.1 hypothetical protein [Desulfobulbaceae bacterium]
MHQRDLLGGEPPQKKKSGKNPRLSCRFFLRAAKFSGKEKYNSSVSTAEGQKIVGSRRASCCCRNRTRLKPPAPVSQLNIVKHTLLPPSVSIRKGVSA